MIDEKYNNYLNTHIEKKEINKSTLKVKARKTLPSASKKTLTKGTTKTKTKKSVTLQTALKIMKEHAKGCPQFNSKLKLAGIL